MKTAREQKIYLFRFDAARWFFSNGLHERTAKLFLSVVFLGMICEKGERTECHEMRF